MELKDVIIKFTPEKWESKILDLEEKRTFVTDHLNTSMTVEAMKAGIPFVVEGKGSYKIENSDEFYPGKK